MAKKKYTEEEKSKIRKKTRKKAFAMSIVTAVFAFFILALLLAYNIKPHGLDSNLFKLAAGTVWAVLFAYLITPIGYIFAVICLITSSMTVYWRNIDKRAKPIIEREQAEEKKRKEEEKALAEAEALENGEVFEETTEEEAETEEEPAPEEEKEEKEGKKKHSGRGITVVSVLILVLDIGLMVADAVFMLLI